MISSSTSSIIHNIDRIVRKVEQRKTRKRERERKKETSFKGTKSEYISHPWTTPSVSFGATSVAFYQTTEHRSRLSLRRGRLKSRGFVALCAVEAGNIAPYVQTGHRSVCTARATRRMPRNRDTIERTKTKNGKAAMESKREEEDAGRKFSGFTGRWRSSTWSWLHTGMGWESLDRCAPGNPAPLFACRQFRECFDQLIYGTWRSNSRRKYRAIHLQLWKIAVEMEGEEKGMRAPFPRFMGFWDRSWKQGVE